MAQGTGLLVIAHRNKQGGSCIMQQNVITVGSPTTGNAPYPERVSSTLPVLFAIAGQALRPGREERQFVSVIHQIFWNETARRKLMRDPEAFIADLKVLPQVKAVLSMMQATLLAGRVTSPGFSWWWGAVARPEMDGDELPTGREQLSCSSARPCAMRHIAVPHTSAPWEELFVQPQRRLRERLLELLAALDRRVRADVARSLEEPGKLLWRSDGGTTGRPAGVWSLLTLLVAEYLSPEVDGAVATTVAVGVECYICALDLIDDVEDADQTPVVEELGVARALSVATTLLFLAQQALLKSSAYAPPAQVLCLLDALGEGSLKATVGQHLDILSAERSALHMKAQDCLGILAAKSGSLMSLACRLGALCAGAPEQACEEWARLGELMGLAHQLDNDAHDVYDDLSADVLTRREEGGRALATKTLPVVLAAHIYTQQRPRAGEALEADRVLWQLALQEALLTTSCTALLYRERVRAYLSRLDAQRRVPPALRFLLVG
jgi:geranylgeranyl pyrophosphate synthase